MLLRLLFFSLSRSLPFWCCLIVVNKIKVELGKENTRTLFIWKLDTTTTRQNISSRALGNDSIAFCIQNAVAAAASATAAVVNDGW